MHQADTIAAVATPPGHGGIGVVRISGARAARIAEAILATVPTPRRVHFGAFRDGDGIAIDRGIALFFRAPHSFTGEDVLELHGHGGPVVMDRLLARCADLGARLARPGEFSERAFLNDKLDLAQAEAIADLIEADTGEAASAAMRSLDGEFSRRVHTLAEEMVRLRVYVEAAIDFADEEIDFLGEGEVLSRLEDIEARLTALRGSAAQGAVLREGLRVVIAGAPNVGKSSLLNRLAGRDTAIVTDTPGTTRDVLAEHIVLDGLPLHVIDTAGLRESVDPVEVEGVRRARGEIERADRLLLVVDDRVGLGDEERSVLEALPTALPVSVIRNKCDLTDARAGRVADAAPETVGVSATTGAGFDDLVAHLKDCAGYRRAESGGFLARRRHLDALDRASDALAAGHAHLERDAAGELLAEELRHAHRALGEITGAFTSEDLLGEIFASFCIGK